MIINTNQLRVKALASFFVVEISLKKINSVFGDKIISKIKPSDLENYQARRQKIGISDGTIDHEIGKAKTMINKAFDNDLVGGDTLKSFRKVKKLVKHGSDARNRILSREEFDNLSSHLRRHAKAIFATGYYTGMRPRDHSPCPYNPSCCLPVCEPLKVPQRYYRHSGAV